MDVLIANNDLMDVVVAMSGVFVMSGFFQVLKTLDTLEQSQVTLQREGLEIRTIPMAVITLKPGMVVRKDDIGTGPWPVRELRDDIILSERLIVGRVVQKEIESATPIQAASLRNVSGMASP